MTIKKHIEFLRIYAEDEVEPVSKLRAKISSAIIYKGHVVAIGCNKNKTHPMAAKYGKNEECNTLHAEVDVILKAQKRLTPQELKKATLLVVRVKCNSYTRIKENYVLGKAKPCAGCERCIAANEIGTVIYTEDCDHRYELAYTTVLKTY